MVKLAYARKKTMFKLTQTTYLIFNFAMHLKHLCLTSDFKRNALSNEYVSQNKHTLAFEINSFK